MLIRGVVEGDVQKDAHTPAVGFAQQGLEVVERAVIGVDGAEVGDVVAVVAGRGEDGHQPEDANFEIVVSGWVPVIEIAIQLAGEALEVASGMVFAVTGTEGADEDLVDEIVGRRGADLAWAGESICRSEQEQQEQGTTRSRLQTHHGSLPIPSAGPPAEPRCGERVRVVVVSRSLPFRTGNEGCP